jgi:hypothetical protein
MEYSAKNMRRQLRHNGRQVGQDLTVIQLETHPIVDLIVCKGYMILVGGVPRYSRLLVTMCAAEVNNVVSLSHVPFLEYNLPPIRTILCSDELLKIANCVIWAALDTY